MHKMPNDLTDDELDSVFSSVESSVDYLIALHKVEQERIQAEADLAEADLVEVELSHARELGFEADALVQNLKRWF